MTPPRDLRLVVVAIGGKTLPALDSTLAPLVELVSIGYRLVLTHGHGGPIPDPRVPALALDLGTAQAQGSIGYTLQQAFENLCRARKLTVASTTLVTRVLVDPADPAFAQPAQPIGPSYTAAQAKELRRNGWALVEAGRRGWRRVVPSPRPLRVLEADLVYRLVQAGAVPIACGGGGVPVVEGPDGYRGVDAVIEKDLASEVLATALGAARMLFVTDVERVAVNFGTPQGVEIERLTVAEARALLGAGEFAPGSMGPKVEASVRFVEAGGREAIITAPARVRAAVEGEAGTRVLAD